MRPTMLDRCDPEIYEYGAVVAVIADRTAAAIERLVQQTARETGQRIDWHYVGGRGVVRVLGDAERVRQALRPHVGGWFVIAEADESWTRREGVSTLTRREHRVRPCAA